MTFLFRDKGLPEDIKRLCAELRKLLPESMTIIEQPDGHMVWVLVVPPGCPPEYLLYQIARAVLARYGGNAEIIDTPEGM